VPSAAAIQAKVTAILAKVQATSKVIRLRTIESAGGNARLGLGQSQVATDVDVVPQPVIERIAAEEISTSGGLYQPGDYRLTFDSSVTERDLRDGFITYGDEVLQAKEVTPVVLYGAVVAWTVVARTVTSGE
jgi:hypothetical protein